MTLIARVERERARLRAMTVGWGAAVALALLALVLAVGAALLGAARWIALPAVVPWLVWLAAAAAAAYTAVRVRRLSRERLSRLQVAAAIEREHALRPGALRGVLELASIPGEGGALGRRAAADLGRRIADGPSRLAPALHRQAVRRGAVGAAALAGAALLVAASPGGWRDGWSAIAHPWRASRGTLLPPLRIEAPGRALRGGAVAVRVSAPGRRRVILAARATGASWATTPLDVRDGGASMELGPLDADLTLVASDGRAASDTMHLHVVDRPFVGDVALRAEYPAYLGRRAEPLAAGEAVRVPRGTILHVEGRASVDLASVSLVRERDTVRLRASGRRFAGAFAAEAGQWDWRASGAADAVADLPPPLAVEVIPDSAPRVEILSPAHDTTVTPGDRVRLTVLAADDHGIAAIVLRTRRVTAAGLAMPEAVQSVATAPGAEWSGDRDVDLAARGLVPGDALHVIAAATDASPWRQTGESRELVLRVPSLSEQRTLARGTADSAVARASAVAAAERQLQQRTSDAARSRGARESTSPPASESRAGARAGARPATASASTPPMSYTSAENAKALAREQRALGEQVKALQDQAKQLERQLQQAGALDSGLSARLQEAQQLLAEALTPQLADELRKLEDAAQQLQHDETQQALGDLAQQQQKLREQLERAVEMLRRAALEGGMQTLRDEARDIAKTERGTGDSAARGDTATAERSRALAKRSEALKNNIDQLGQQLAAARAEQASERMPEARQRADTSAAAMRQAASESRPGDAARDAREAAQQMDQAAQQLSDARQRQIEEWKTELTDDLDQSVAELRQLAQQENQIDQHMKAQQTGTGARGEQSAVQQGVERTAGRLEQAGRKSSLLSPRAQRDMAGARQKVEQATREVAREQGQGQGRDASEAVRDAADALNQAAASLARDREHAANATSASGFEEMLERMRAMAKEQGALNAQAQGLQLGAAGQAARDAAAQALASRQRALAQRLDQLAEGDGSGNAAAMAREAQQIAQALDRGALDQNLLDRQQRLFRRLLDAGQTLEQDEREDTGKRESRAATDAQTFSPAAGSASGRAAARYREPTWNELRGLSADERRLVLDYFRRINAGP